MSLLYGWPWPGDSIHDHLKHNMGYDRIKPAYDLYPVKHV